MKKRDLFLVATLILPCSASAFAAETGTATVPPTNSAQTNPKESLSSKLSKTNGVIKPKTNVDPGIKVPAPVPHPHTTPVIPPSATGGGTAK